MAVYLIVGQHNWSRSILYEIKKRLYDDQWKYFEDEPEKLPAFVDTLRPDKIFFAHWSYMVQKGITDNYECICFHPSHLPYGRGGTPVQNLIMEGFNSTQLTAFKMTEELDAGPIYLQIRLKLDCRTAQDIYNKIAKLTVDMIENIIKYNLQPRPQEGEPHYFKRRTPDQSEICGGWSLRQLYDHIRMLSAEDYPLAFLDVDSYHMRFSSPSFRGDGGLQTKVIITLNE